MLFCSVVRSEGGIEVAEKLAEETEMDDNDKDEDEKEAEEEEEDDNGNVLLA